MSVLKVIKSLLLSSCVLLTGSAYNSSNQAFFNFNSTNIVKDNGALFNDLSSENYFSPNQTNQINLVGADENFSETDFPSSLDLRDYGVISAVKTQGGYGTCWVQTATDSAETSLIEKNPLIQLSSWHTAYYTYYGDEQVKLDVENAEELFNYGGANLNAINLWAQWIGPANNSYTDIEYGDVTIFSDEELQKKYADLADYHLDNAYSFDYDGTAENREIIKNTIKSFLLNEQCVASSYYNNGNGYNEEFNSYNQTTYVESSHSVTIVGWDDNFSADNFNENCKPDSDGAWLMKNSWGANWMDNGFFWMSYEDATLSNFNVYELTDNDNYSNIYQHDSFVSTQTMRSSLTSNTSYMANVFTSEREEQLEAVSTYFVASNTSYEISIYKNLKSKSKPNSGTLISSVSGTIDVSGYHTIPLDECVNLSNGDTFSIVIKVSNLDIPFLIPIESAIALINPDTNETLDLSNSTQYNQIKTYTNENESFYSSDKQNWSDVTSGDYYYSEDDKQYLYETMLSIYGQEYMASINDAFENSDAVLTMGNIPIKAFTNPINHVSFSEQNGFIYQNETVELSDYNNQTIYFSINGEDYIEYTEPIEINSESIISATTDFETFSTKNYSPAKSIMSSLSYIQNNEFFTLEPDENGNYTIEFDEYISEISLLPISLADIEINGQKYSSYEPTSSIPLKNGLNTIDISLTLENAQSSEITLEIYSGEEVSTLLLGDVNNDGIIDSVDASNTLNIYSELSTQGTSNYNEDEIYCADYNQDYIIDSVDASQILNQYAISSTK